MAKKDGEPDLSRNAQIAIRSIKKGEFEKSVALIIASMIKKFDEEGWKTAKLSDLIQLLILLRGVMTKNQEGKSPIDEWLISVSKRVDTKIRTHSETEDEHDE
tara:strand:+ start:1101 stop:1409 length:309 start_codon:yes stop_codon:yes gene_type:complete